MNNSFLNNSQLTSQKFYEIAGRHFEFYRKILGIEVEVTRHKESTEVINVYGSSYTSDLDRDSDTESFRVRVVLNRTLMLQKWDLNEPIEYTDVTEIFERGDIVTYVDGDLSFSYKVDKATGFTTRSDAAFSWSLIPAKELKV